MTNSLVTHKCQVNYDFDRQEWLVRCSCGAKWTVPESRGELEIGETFAAHVRYFDHKPSVTL